VNCLVEWGALTLEYPDDDPGTCGDDCVALVDFGCIHEHIEVAIPVCAEHLKLRQALHCSKCQELGHLCPVLAGNVHSC
jgi:hypothetical protein